MRGYRACLQKFAMAANGAMLREPQDLSLEMDDGGGTGPRRMSSITEASGMGEDMAATPPMELPATTSRDGFLDPNRGTVNVRRPA